MAQTVWLTEPAWAQTRRRAMLGLPQAMRRDHTMRQSLQLSWMTFWVAKNMPMMKRTFTNNNSRLFAPKTPGKTSNWDRVIDHLQVQSNVYLQAICKVSSSTEQLPSHSHIQTQPNEDQASNGLKQSQISAAAKMKVNCPGPKISKKMLQANFLGKMIPVYKALPRIFKKCHPSMSRELSNQVLKRKIKKKRPSPKKKPWEN